MFLNVILDIFLNVVFNMMHMFPPDKNYIKSTTFSCTTCMYNCSCWLLLKDGLKWLIERAWVFSNWPKLAWSCVLMLSLPSLVLAILCFCCKVSYKTNHSKRDINIIVRIKDTVPTGRPNHTCPEIYRLQTVTVIRRTFCVSGQCISRIYPFCENQTGGL